LALISDYYFVVASVFARRRRYHERIDLVLARQVAAEDHRLGVNDRSLTNRVLQPLHRMSTKRLLRETRTKVCTTPRSCRLPDAPAMQRTTGGWRSSRC
jgi:hypothetical protein